MESAAKGPTTPNNQTSLIKAAATYSIAENEKLYAMIILHIDERSGDIIENSISESEDGRAAWFKLIDMYDKLDQMAAMKEFPKITANYYNGNMEEYICNVERTVKILEAGIRTTLQPEVQILAL